MNRLLLVPRRRFHALILLWLSLALSGCTGLFLYPDRVRHLPDRAIGTPAEEQWIPAQDGSRMHALFLPAQGPRRATVLFLHGNAENLSSHVHAVSWLPAQGYAVLALDYRGFGLSEGRANVDAIHQDAAAALAWLLAQEPTATGPLIVYGQSLGGSVAIRLVAQADAVQRQRIAALIADSAFSSYRGIAREKLAQVWLTWPLQAPLSLLISNRYSAVDVVDRIGPIPLLLLHGENDVVVPFSHSQRLYAEAREPKEIWLIPGGQHIDLTRRESVRQRLLQYLDTAAGKAAP